MEFVHHTVWKKALVVPIFKKGDAADPSNYRPISELCVPGKLLSNILNDVLYGRLEEQGLIPDEQGGFRVGRGCPEMVFILHSVLLNRLRAGCRTYVAFVDVKKAYDTVCRPGLLLRLLELGTPEHVWALIREWYSGDSACIFMGGKQSTWFDTTLGVKQGDVASPILYSVFINPVVAALQCGGVDLFDGRPPLRILLFADDMCVLAEDADALQRMLDVVSAFADANRFKVSTGVEQTKSMVMIYGDSWPLVAPSFSLCGDVLPFTDTYVYLGVTLHHQGEWGPYLDALRAKVFRRLAILKKSAGMHSGGFAVRRIRELMWAEFACLWEYAAGALLLSASEEQSVVLMWQAVLRSAVGVPSYVSCDAVAADMDLLQAWPTARYMMYRVNLWHKIANSLPSQLLSRAAMLWQRHGCGRPAGKGRFCWTKDSCGNWRGRVRLDLQRLGLCDCARLQRGNPSCANVCSRE